MTPTTFLRMLAISAALAIPAAWSADTQSPAGATGQCNDGSYTTAQSRKGACADHKGVKSWFAESKPASTASTAPAPSATQTQSNANVAAGGGNGRVWVNTRSKVYHCEGDKWYGKTKHGEYMTEAEAKAKGNHADHGKACSA